MKVGTISADEIAEKGSLLPSDYLLDSKLESRNVLREWNSNHHNVLGVTSLAFKDLEAKVATALELAYEMGRRRGR
jgi:hypothetical protein